MKATERDRAYQEALRMIRGPGAKGKPTKEEHEEAKKLVKRLEEKYDELSGKGIELPREIRERNEQRKIANRRNRLAGMLKVNKLIKELEKIPYFRQYAACKGTTIKEIAQKMKLHTAAYAVYGVISDADDFVGVHRVERKEWQRNCEMYNKALEEAFESFVDSLEGIAIQRAKKGSDSLLKFLLQAYRPKKFSNKVHANLEVEAGDVVLSFSENMLSDVEKRRMQDKEYMLNEGVETGVVN